MRYLDLYKDFVTIHLKVYALSKANVFIGVFGFLLTQASGIIFLQLVFQRIPSINDWSFYEVLFIYGFFQLPRGLDHLYSDHLWLLARDSLIKGDFDRYLLRPLPPLFQVIVERFQLDALGEIIIGSAILVVAISNLSLHITFSTVCAFFICVVFSTIIYTALKLIFASLAFWVKQSFAVLYSMYMIADFAKYPITIYPAFLQFALLFVLPYAFTSYVPASAILGKSVMWSSVFHLLIVVVIVVAIAALVWKQGIKRYDSSGN